MRWGNALLAVGLVSVGTVGCGGPPSDPSGELLAVGMVVEAADGPPTLCMKMVRASVPPQCEGLPLVGFDWDDVPQPETRSGATWASVAVEGMCQDGRFYVRRPLPQHAVSFGPSTGVEHCYGERSQSSR